MLHVGQPAVAVRGVGDVLYGVKPPAGKLVQTIYEKAYATQVSIFDFNMRPGPSAWCVGASCRMAAPAWTPHTRERGSLAGLVVLVQARTRMHDQAVP